MDHDERPQHQCRSCTWLPIPYDAQLATKEKAVWDALAERAADAVWLPSMASAPRGFRTRARMAVGGTPRAITLGYLDTTFTGVDLRECKVYAPALHAAIPVVAQWLNDLAILPYSVAKRRGELKNVVFTSSPDDELALQLVLRSDVWLERLRQALPDLLDALPGLRVVTVNLLPEHVALPAGDVEIPLTDDVMLPIRVTDITLFTQAGSFQQTNTAIAAGLYRQARDWVEGLPTVSTVWDLYCGVGGFALHVAGPGRKVTGVELADDAVACAHRAAALHAQLHAETAGVDATETAAEDDAPLAVAVTPAATFVCADATAWAAAQNAVPDLVVVNPPRRGLGAELADWVETSGIRHVIYTSCNATTLVADLARMPSLQVKGVRLFDMFPNTEHAEVMVLLHRG